MPDQFGTKARHRIVSAREEGLSSVLATARCTISCVSRGATDRGTIGVLAVGKLRRISGGSVDCNVCRVLHLG